MSDNYRQNVAAILVNSEGKILVAERIDRPGAWQFPQGGIDKGEAAEDALHRELKEEIGLLPDHFVIMDQRGGYRYDFPDGVSPWKGKYGGQEQTYFLCRFHGRNEDIDINLHDAEFSAWKWIAPGEFDLDWLPEFKRDVYSRVLADFFEVVDK